MLLKLLLLPVVLYLAVLTAIYFAQTSLLFPARLAGGALLSPGSARVSVQTPQGERLHGVHIPAHSPQPGPRLVILGFGGNAWNAEAAADYLAQLFPQADIVAFHYRGYAPSHGKPSADALLADALLVHDWTVSQLKPGRLVAIGFSIGSGVAARLAGKRSLAGLILVTPFDSLTQVAAGHYPWLPVRWMFRHEMPAAHDLSASRVPAAIIAAERDTIILPRRTDALRAAVPNLVFDRTVAGAGHNDLYDRPEFRRAMVDALEAIERGGAR